MIAGRIPSPLFSSKSTKYDYKIVSLPKLKIAIIIVPTIIPIIAARTHGTIQFETRF